MRIFNTNTKKLIHARFPLQDGRAQIGGDLAIPGVHGTGAPVKLDFIAPGGATTGKLLPTGRPLDRLDVPGLGAIDVSMVDAANACVFVRARDVGLTGRELPDALEADPAALGRLAAVRIAASQAMGIAKSEAEARAIAVVPFICVISARADASTLSGELVRAARHRLRRALRLERPAASRAAADRRAVHRHRRAHRRHGRRGSAVATASGAGALRIGMPSGVLTVAADVGRGADGGWVAHSGSFYRTARRLFDGRVHVSLDDAAGAGRSTRRLTEVA